MKKRLAAGVAVAALGDADERDSLGDAELGEHRAHRRELALAAVDEDEVGPGRSRHLSRLVVARGRRLALRPASLSSRAKRRRITSRIMP